MSLSGVKSPMTNSCVCMLAYLRKVRVQSSQSMSLSGAVCSRGKRRFGVTSLLPPLSTSNATCRTSDVDTWPDASLTTIWQRQAAQCSARVHEHVQGCMSMCKDARACARVHEHVQGSVCMCKCRCWLAMQTAAHVELACCYFFPAQISSALAMSCMLGPVSFEVR